MRWLLPVAVLALAGCASPAGPDLGETADDDEATTLSAHGTLTFTFTNVETPAPDVSGDNGCYIDAPSLTRVVNGTVAVTWTPGPTTRDLRLSASSAGTGIVSVYADETQGPPPLSLSLQDVAVPESLAFIVRAPEPGVAYEQEVTLTWVMRYEGKPVSEWPGGGCPATQGGAAPAV